MSYTDINCMKMYLKTTPMLLIATAALVALTLIAKSDVNISTTSLNATNILDDLINHFLIEEMYVYGGCAYIRGVMANGSAILTQFNVIIKRIEIVHCREKIYIFLEIQQLP
jgi:hypothetical protein